MALAVMGASNKARENMPQSARIRDVERALNACAWCHAVELHVNGAQSCEDSEVRTHCKQTTVCTCILNPAREFDNAARANQHEWKHHACKRHKNRLQLALGF